MRQLPEFEGQLGLASHAQLAKAGWTRSALLHFTKTVGSRPLPTVYCGHRRPLSRDERCMAGYLWARGEVALTGLAALQLQGVLLESYPVALRFVGGPTRHPRAVGSVVLVASTRPPRSRLIGGIPVVRIERALVDAARYQEVTGSDSEALTISVLEQRLTEPQRLLAEVRAGNPCWTRGVHDGIRLYQTGAWSMPEATLAGVLAQRQWEAAMNPRLLTQSGDLIGVPDAYLPAFGVAIQVHSQAFHAGFDAAGDRWAATVEADAAYTEYGITTLGVAPRTLSLRPSSFLKRLDAVVAQRVGQTPPAVIVQRVQASFG